MIYAFPPFELDEALFELRREGEQIPVQPKVLALLFFLVRERSRMVTKAQILEAVWPGVFVGEASLSRAVSEARKAIGDDAQEVIHTVRGRGFRFAGQVTSREPPPKSERALAPAQPMVARQPAGPLIGRDASLAVLRARLADAAGCRGNLVWLSGEAGIGKTFLLEAFAAEAAAAGARVAWARSHRDDLVLPYWSWTQIARSSSLPPADAEAAERAVEVLRGAGAATEARFAGFDAVTRAITRTTRTQPLLLAFDDIEHADEASLALLRFFVRETRETGVLVVATFRDVSGPWEPEALRGLVRDHDEHIVSLRPLSRADLAQLAAAHTGYEPRPHLIDWLVDKSGGHPLFARRLLESDWATRAMKEVELETQSSLDLKAGVLASINDHLGKVTGDCTAALVSASVLGRSFSFPALAATSGASTESLLTALSAATTAKLVVKTKGGGYKFAHALVRDVLYRAIPAAERAARHKAAGHALLAAYGDPADAHAAELAHHFLRAAPAGEADLARVYATRAAEEAEISGDPARAAAHWADAVEALGYSPSATTARLSTQMSLAAALVRAGQTERAQTAYLDAVTLARAFSAPATLAEAALAFTALVPPDSLAVPELLRQAALAADKVEDASGAALRSLVTAAIERTRAAPG